MSISSDSSLQVNQLPVSVQITKDADVYEIISLLYKRLAAAINTKEGAYYDLLEQGNFKQFFTSNQPYKYRPCYRYTFDLVSLNAGNIPAAATVSFPHGITNITSAALVYASCTSVAGDYFTVVFPDASADLMNINFTNPLATDLSSAIFVFEYMKL